MNQTNVTSQICENSKVSGSTLFGQLHKTSEEVVNQSSTVLKIKDYCSQNPVKFNISNKAYDKENQQIAISKINPQKLSNYGIFEPLSDNTNIKALDNRHNASFQ